MKNQTQKAPAFQFYPDDFLGGTLTMTLEERGLYITALCLQWTQGGVSKTDIKSLGSAMAVPSLKRVLLKFSSGADGLLRNEKLERVRAKQNEFRENRSKNGKMGAETRWLSHSTAIPNTMAKNSSPSPTPTPTKEEGKDASLPAQVKEVFNAWNLLECVPKCLIVSDKRRRMLEVRLREPFFAANWREAMSKVKLSPFLQGQNNRGWRASFEWFIAPDSVSKIMEGKYANNPIQTTKANPRNAGICIPTDEKNGGESLGDFARRKAQADSQRRRMGAEVAKAPALPPAS